MRILYHWTLDPASRQARIAMAETKLKLKIELIDPWALPENFTNICIEARPPALMDHTQNSHKLIIGARAICEYASEITTRQPLMPKSPFARSEVRRLCDWFENRFQDEVISYILSERVEKSLLQNGRPDPDIIQHGRRALEFHLDYMNWILSQEEWLAGPEFSLADIAAGANISCLDYLGEIAWKNYPHLKPWYQLFKSRPSVRGILTDKLPSIRAPLYYADPDF